jgi:hypothetical protein
VVPLFEPLSPSVPLDGDPSAPVDDEPLFEPEAPVALGSFAGSGPEAPEDLLSVA